VATQQAHLLGRPSNMRMKFTRYTSYLVFFSLFFFGVYHYSSAHSISAVNLTNGNSTATSSTQTASTTPKADRLLLLTVSTRTDSGDPNTPTATGNGLTWDVVRTLNYDNSGSQKRLTVFRSMGTPTGGKITIGFASQTQSDVVWSLDEFANVDTSGSNGSGAVVQSAQNSNTGGANTTLTVTLGAFASADNSTWGGIVFGNGTGVGTVGSGFTQLAQKTSGANLLLMSEWKVANDTSVDASTTAGGEVGGVAIELKLSTVSASSASTTSFFFSPMSGTTTCTISSTSSSCVSVGGDGTLFFYGFILFLLTFCVVLFFFKHKV